jgi:hypothetical protein
MFRPVRTARIVLAFAAFAGTPSCDDSNTCSTTTNASPVYSCTPHPIDAGGCPAINYPGTETVDGAYPFGCNATFPACSGFSSSPSPVACICGAKVDGAIVPDWTCPN